MADPVVLDRRLPPRAASPALARGLVSEALDATPFADLVDDALVAVSELVTNALVHAGTEIGLQVTVDRGGVLVEVEDGNPQAPVVRRHAREAGTGRGLHMVAGLADEWGVEQRGEGKVVWFRMGQPGDQVPGPGVVGRGEVRDDVRDDAVTVELLDFPVLIHAAWQEHAATLLREYLLMSLSEGDETEAFVRHAEVSEALHLLAAQAPPARVGDDADHVMADAVEPLVTEPRFVLTVPRAMLANVDALDQMMDEAIAAADRGEMLVPPTQPEAREMRRWLCDQIRAQALTGAEPEPYAADLHHDVVSEPQVPPGWDVAEVASSPLAVVASNDSGQIVAVSAPAAELLGHRPDALVGRRVVALIPHRFRQAHVAGMTLHAINGRAPLIGHEVTVPVLLADGGEREVTLLLQSLQVGHRRLFVAELRPS